MTEHAPECHYVEDTGDVRYGWNDCICDELRACEERMLEAAVQRVEALPFPWPNTWPGMIRRGDVITAIKGEQ